MNSVLNVSAYRFVAIDDAPALAGHVQALAEAAALKGTVLVAPEGINLFLAGDAAAVRGLLDALRADARLAGLRAHESWSAQVPFSRLRVKLKREIIRMDRPMPPAAARAPALDPATLARWLDAGRDDAGREVVMLDTRNVFEVEAGRFRGAVHWNLARFGEFPAAAATHAEALRDKTVVSYCTGGIRCEKAAQVLAEAGLASVWQLDGGILRWFETQGGRHYEGDCTVFDDRGQVGPDLRPAPALPENADA